MTYIRRKSPVSGSHSLTSPSILEEKRAAASPTARDSTGYSCARHSRTSFRSGLHFYKETLNGNRKLINKAHLQGHLDLSCIVSRVEVIVVKHQLLDIILYDN